MDSDSQQIVGGGRLAEVQMDCGRVYADMPQACFFTPPLTRTKIGSDKPPHTLPKACKHEYVRISTRTCTYGSVSTVGQEVCLSVKTMQR